MIMESRETGGNLAHLLKTESYLQEKLQVQKEFI